MFTRSLSLGRIAEIITPAARPLHADRVIRHLLVDSRSLLSPADTLFFALTTPSGDGHNYIRHLYDRGVRSFVTGRLPDDAAAMAEADFLVVADPLEALQALGHACRDTLKGRVVGITGSRGKTVVKEWAGKLFAACGRSVWCSPRSFNSRIGVPLSLWQADPEAEFVFIEAGISREGEMAPLAAMIRPDVALLTAITSEHDHGFTSRAAKIAEKWLLASGASEAVFSADIPGVDYPLPAGIRRFDWSAVGDDAFLRIESIRHTDDATLFTALCRGERFEAEACVTTRPLADDIATLLTLALSQGLQLGEVVKAVTRLRKPDTRLKVVDALGEGHLLIDRFDSTIQAADQALDFAARRLTADERLTLVTTPIPGLDAIVRGRAVSTLICIGALPEGDYGDCTALAFPDVDSFLAAMPARQLARCMTVIMAAGAPDLLRIAELLEARRHETVLEVNLDAVVDNLNFFRSLVRPETRVCCMIKASGYGAGSVELARTLQSHGASYLAVAVHDEGAELRHAGITMPVIVLNPQVDSLQSIFANRLEPEIYSLDFLRQLIDEAERCGVREFPVHIKIDSGMHRLGFLLETLPEVIALLKTTDAVVARSIFTHLACADDPAEDDYTRAQFDYFARCCEMLLSAFPDRKILRHILNSTGIVRFPEQQLDMVRLGIGLYGHPTLSDGSMDALRPVSALYASIISIKEWPAGTTIGYNRRGLLTRPSVIATVPIGYADGLSRGLGRGAASMIVRGHACPTVGNICMDACMIDVTDVPGVSVGDRVEVFGPSMPVENLSDTLSTISYEVIAGISPRVKRVYFRE
ncbi:MAG: alanine racemase [Duncaniella sp.]|nr:alanine racemase [Duncaniella sp.]